MRGMLIEEGIAFKDEYVVDLEQCLWDPDQEDRVPDGPPAGF
jgi:hypothetical protein